MELPFSEWLARCHYDQIERAVASSKRGSHVSYRKEVVQKCKSESSKKWSFKHTAFTKTQDLTKTFSGNECREWIASLPKNWKQLELFFSDGEVQHLRFLDPEGSRVDCSLNRIFSIESGLHNRVKQLPFQDGELFMPFYALGLMTEDGKVRADQRKKFDQVNAFIKLIEPTIDDWVKRSSPTKTLTLLDAGCGKGYLTHALSFHFSERHSGRISVIGIDAREDVIDQARKAGYGPLFFQASIGNLAATNVAQYVGEGDVALIALHACNTATDVTLIQAHEMGAKLFFISPCCHKELSGIFPNDTLSFVAHHPIMKQRLAVLLTDAMRAAIMASLGWSVDILEFIDPENTPKNTLLRGVFRKRCCNLPKDLEDMLASMQQKPLLARTLLKPTLPR